MFLILAIMFMAIVVIIIELCGLLSFIISTKNIGGKILGIFALLSQIATGIVIFAN